MFLLPLGNNIKEFQSNKTLESKLMSKILYIWIDDKILLIGRKENRIAKPDMWFFLWSWRVLTASMLEEYPIIFCLETEIYFPWYPI